MATKQFTITLHIRFHECGEDETTMCDLLNASCSDKKIPLVDIRGSILGDLDHGATMTLDEGVSPYVLATIRDIEHFKHHTIFTALRTTLFELMKAAKPRK
jgi:hypothetical protein